MSECGTSWKRTIPGAVERDWGDFVSLDELLLTRDDVLRRVQQFGHDVSVQTLAYWEAHGVLPRAIRRWRDGAPRALYPARAVDLIVLVAANRASDHAASHSEPCPCCGVVPRRQRLARVAVEVGRRLRKTA